MQTADTNKKEFTFVYRLCRFLCRIIFHTIFPTRYIGRKIIKNLRAPYILVCNHQHAFDPLALSLLTSYEIRFLGKKELTAGKFSAWLLSRLHMISIARHESDIHAMRLCTQVLRNQHVLGIFPEGTRSPGHLLEHLESGFALLALRERKPIIPAYIQHPFRFFHHNSIIVSEPIQPEQFPIRDSLNDSALALSQMVHDRFLQLSQKLSQGEYTNEQIG